MVKKLFTHESSLFFLLMTLVGIKLLGVLFATRIFASFSPLIDSNLYLSNFYVNDTSFRTSLVQLLSTFISSIAGPFLTHLIFGLISVMGFAYYYARGGRSWLILLFLLLPSSLIWTSIVGKEALFFGGMGLCLFIWSKFSVEKLDRLDWGGLIIGFSLCLMMRPHYGIVLVWLFTSTALVKRFEGNSAPLLLMGYILLGSAIYYFVWDELLLRGFYGIESTARASRFDFFGIDPKTSLGFEKFKQLVPLGIILGIIGPAPSELIDRVEFSPFFLEGVLILLLPFIIALNVYKKDFVFKAFFFRIFWFCLLPGVLFLMIIHAPFGLLNPGSAIRWRTDFEQLLYLAPTILFLRCIRARDEKNPTLSPK
jgi:hypothetical protein